VAKLLQPSETEIPGAPGFSAHDWLAAFDTNVSEGTLSPDERKVIESYRSLPSQRSHVKGTGSVTNEERRLLKKSKN